MVVQSAYKTILVGLIIGLLLGGGAGCIYGQFLISEYKEKVSELEKENLELLSTKTQLEYDVDRLEMENIELSSTQTQLEEEYATLNMEYINLETNFEDLKSSVEKQENDYRGLLSTLSVLDAKNYSRIDGFDLLPGQTQRYEYDVGYGIIWVVEISHMYSGGSRWVCQIGWWQGEQGGLVSGESITIEQQLSKITGTISTRVHDEGDMLFISSLVNVPEVPRFGRDGSGRLLKKTFEEREIVVNGDFEEPAWNINGWETSGHLGVGSGEDSIEGKQLGLVQDLGAVASQKVQLYESDLNLEFYYRPVPMNSPITFIVYFDDNIILNETFTGSILSWDSMRINLNSLIDAYGEHTIKFVVPKSPNCTDGSSRIMIDKVSIS